MSVMIRLLHTSSLELHEFEGSNVPPYAILSHTWGIEEVTFAIFQDKNKRQQRLGWEKITKCCRYAASYALHYVWIDTCCIDKSSSAELSEAINSMFHFYRAASLCLAYLADLDIVSCDTPSAAEAFRSSRWFTRGWTLQELLAPRRMIFLNQEWCWLGTKSTLQGHIYAATGIKKHDAEASRAASIAKRMSWASKRKTTRPEDIAYCLLGLFDVNMPLLYGEGPQKAFLRLQLEIIKQSDDESIFAWDDDGNPSGLLAQNPIAFINSYDIVRHPFYSRPHFQMTNKGLQITFILESSPARPRLPQSNVYRTALNCTREGVGGVERPRVAIGLLLARIARSEYGVRYYRVGYLDPMGRGRPHPDVQLSAEDSVSIYVPQVPHWITGTRYDDGDDDQLEHLEELYPRT